MRTYLITYRIGESDDYSGIYSEIVSSESAQGAKAILNESVKTNGFHKTIRVTEISFIEEFNNVNVPITPIDPSIDIRYEENLIEAFNKFIKKWCGNMYGHLIDTDENDGQFMRDKIIQLQRISNPHIDSTRTLLSKERILSLPVKTVPREVLYAAMGEWDFNPLYYYPEGLTPLEGERGYDKKYRYIVNSKS